MKKMLPVCGYAVSALLFLSYVMILGTSLFPKVCAEYRLYYIERELQDWPGYGGLQYRLGTPVVFRSTEEDRTRRCGNSWNSFEEDGCWTYGGHSALYFSGIFQNPGKEDGGAGNAGEEEKKRYVEIDVQEVREGAVSQVCANGEPLEGVNKIAKTIENKGFSRKGKADGKNFVRWKPLHILERCKEKRQGKTAVRHGLGIVFKL